MMGVVSRLRDGARVDVYTIHEPPFAPADRIDRAERLVFLKDGFSWGAFLLAPLWLAARAEWAGLAAYVSAAIVLTLLLTAIGAAPAWITLAILALNLFLGFEASSLKRWSLERTGWTELGAVSGRNAAECERRFFETWLPGQPVIAARDTTQSIGTLAASAGDVGRRKAARSLGGWRGLLGMKA
jgi:hypothetical protein